MLVNQKKIRKAQSYKKGGHKTKMNERPVVSQKVTVGQRTQNCSFSE